MRALLDVNVIIALLDSNHAFHEPAHAWWEEEASSGWATCPLTENGVVRVMSHPGYSQSARFTPAELVERLRLFVHHTDHAFWADDVSLRDMPRFAIDRLHSSRQVTDAYLLGLAVEHGGRLVTFDRASVTATVPGAKPRHLVVVGD